MKSKHVDHDEYSLDIDGNTDSSTDIEYNSAMMFGKNARKTNTSA